MSSLQIQKKKKKIPNGIGRKKKRKKNAFLRGGGVMDKELSMTAGRFFD